jgi:hypothetical protein
MVGARKLLLGAVAVSAVVGNVGEAAGSVASVSHVKATTAGGPQAIVVAQQTANSSRVRMNISLHSLEPETNYRVVASTQRCSEAPDSADPGVWRWNLRSTDGGQTYKAKTLPASGRLADVHSIVIFEGLQPSPQVVACGVTAQYSNDTGVLTLTQGRAAQGEVTRLSLAFPAGRGMRGIIVAKQVGNARRVSILAGLHGLQPKARYTLVANRKRCSSRFDGTRVWSALFRSDDAGRNLIARTVAVDGLISSARSDRVFSFNGPQGACGFTAIYDSGTGVLT